MPNYYQLLSISPDASRGDILTAYRQAALKYHPDLNSDPVSTEMFRKINQAYQTIINPSKRRSYDATINLQEDHSITENYDLPVDEFLTFFQNSWLGLKNKMEVFFGEFGSDSKDQEGLDIHTDLQISADFARNGGVQEFAFECIDQIDGQEVIDTRTLKIKIPAGIAANQKIRLRGLGAVSSDQSKFGDLYLNVQY